jgi:DNA-binding transcriptional regulator YiaG
MQLLSSCRQLSIPILDASDLALNPPSDTLRNGQPDGDTPNMLRRDTQLSCDAAINTAKKCNVSKLRRRMLEVQIQLKPPDCEIEHNARFNNLSSTFMPPRPKKLDVVPEVARQIRMLRESRAESQTQFAAVLGTMPSAVSKWEAGKNRPTPDAFRRMAVIASGDPKKYFLAEAGIPFNDEGEIDLGLTRIADELRTQSARALGRIRSARHRGESQEAKQIIWDPDLLLFVMETINNELRKRRLRLPSNKFAEAVIISYEYCYRTGQRDSEMVGRLLKIA